MINRIKCFTEGPEGVKWELAGIDLLLDWENGIWVAGTGIWSLGWEMKSSKMGMR